MTGITIVVPSIGRRQLDVCLASLANQRPAQPSAVLCILNGSAPVAPAFHAPWLRVIRDARPSVANARNLGVELSTTEWVAFLDDDCIAPTRWLASLEAYARTHPEVGVAGGAVVEAARRGWIYEFMEQLNYMRSPYTMKLRPSGIPSLGGANMLVRRDCLLSLGGFDPRLASSEDYDLLVSASRSGWTLGTYLDMPPVTHVHDTSALSFVRRYWRYGQGVAAVVGKHSLDPEPHRIYSLDTVGSLPRASWRFAMEDIAWLRSHRGRLTFSTYVLAVLRAASWQAGAWHERHAHA